MVKEKETAMGGKGEDGENLLVEVRKRRGKRAK